MRRKPLFHPPRDARTHKRKHNKGRQDYTVLTVNGRVRLWRRRWHSAADGTTTPLDRWVDAAEASISLGVREMACRLNGDSKNFDKAAANLARTAQVEVVVRRCGRWWRRKANAWRRRRSRANCRSTGQQRSAGPRR